MRQFSDHLSRSKYTLPEIVQALDARRCGQGHIARCPAHDDRSPSLSISEKNGRVLFHCHAGCRQEDVMTALCNLGVWHPGNRHDRDWVARPISRNQHRPRHSSAPEKNLYQPLGPVIATYTYTDANQNPLFRINRHEPKNFRAQRMTRFGTWVDGIREMKPVPYHLPELLENTIIFITEGEKDVETLRSHGFTATTNPFGAGQWPDTFNPLFASKEVYILLDNDEPGISRARKIAQELLPFAASVNVLLLVGAKDITDWFNLGHSELELIALTEVGKDGRA